MDGPPSAGMPPKRKSSQVENGQPCPIPSGGIHGSNNNSQPPATEERNKIRRIDEPHSVDLQSNVVRGQRQDYIHTAATAQPTQDQSLPRAQDSAPSNNRQPATEIKILSSSNYRQDQVAASTVAIATIPQSQLSQRVYNWTGSFCGSFERFPLNGGGLYTLPSQLQIFVSTFRPSAFQARIHQSRIILAINALRSPPNNDSYKVFSWHYSNEMSSCADNLPTFRGDLRPPPKIDMPHIQIGHLFSAAVFGNDHDIPLYYFQIVRGLPAGFKVVVCSSKQEVSGSIIYEALCGFSTVFICAVCQSVTDHYLAEGAACTLSTNSGVNVKKAKEILERDYQVAVIY